MLVGRLMPDPTLTPAQERALRALASSSGAWWPTATVDTRMALRTAKLIAFDGDVNDYRLTDLGRRWLAERDHAG